MKAIYLSLIVSFSLACTDQSKRTNGPMTGEAYGDDSAEDAYAPASDDLTEQEVAEEDAKRLYSSCELSVESPAFPAETEGMAFRAWVRFSISASGKAEHICYARVEGLHKYEQKAMADRGQWDFDTKYAGEPRERLVTYRKTPPKN